VLAVSLLLVFLVVRHALFQFYSSKDPSRIARVWAGHPSAILESGLTEIGDTAAAGRPVSPAVVDRLLAASAKAPLAPEPFLVRGVAMQLAGDQKKALPAFLAARQRNPRSIPSRYFLADQYLKLGQAGAGLAEISVLARLVPDSMSNVAPFLAAFARSPGAAPQVKAVLRTHPQLETILLTTLSGDASNLDLILNLWSGRGGEQARTWQSNLLAQLVESGRYEQARETWARFTGIAAEPDGLFDAEFGKVAMPPFGWKFESGSAGVAEPEGNGRLRILYYGRDNSVLASQLLTLKPGRYAISMVANATSSSPDSLQWTVSCLPAANPIFQWRLDFAGRATKSLSVPPANCRAQRLELSGTAPEIPQQAEVTISQFGIGPEHGK